MLTRSMLFGGHLLGWMLILFSLWRLVENMAVLPDYMLMIALAAVTGLVLNHFRWWRLGRMIKDGDTLAKVHYLIVSNYLVMMLGFVLLDFKQ